MPTANFRDHHIEGFAVAAMRQGKDGGFSCDLISEIVPNLWMGGCRDGVALGDEFSFVMSLYPWEKFTLDKTTQRIEHKLYDSEEIPSPAVIRELAEHVNAMRAEGQTLVHCQAGLNRSGLVTALALMIGPEKMSAPDAIALLREKRTPLVLCNQFFERWLVNAEAAAA